MICAGARAGPTTAGAPGAAHNRRVPVLSVGIDVAESRKGIDLVALDAGRAIVAAYAGRTVDEIARLVLETLRPDVVCIDSPSQWAPPGQRREAERSLTRRGINLFTTPSELRARAFHGWMRQGFGIYQALGSVYPRYRGGAVRGTAAEYYPHLSSVALRGYIGDIRKKLEFRRAVLEEHGIAVAELRGQDQVDAALGALTGLIALEGGHTWVGLDEDALLVPLRDLPDRFVRWLPGVCMG
jgi:predicted nuclease with RNAse H fold